MGEHIENEEIGHLTKAQFYDAICVVRDLFEEVCSLKIEFEMKMRRTNPFWPHPLTPELLKMLKKWGGEEQKEKEESIWDSDKK